MSSSIVSIIVPVYNAEKYLNRCLNSLHRQTFTDIEIICVDDGSTDGSFNILQSFSKVDNRFKLISQTNQGRGSARNAALNIVSGKFVMFCDADDEYDLYMCEIMVGCINKYNTDIVMCHAHTYDNSNKNYEIHGFDKTVFPVMSGLHDLDIDFKVKVYTNVWNKIFKTDIIRRYNIKFTDTRWEDVFFVVSYMSVSRNIYCIDKRLYYRYLYSESGIANFMNGIDGYKDFISVINMYKSIYKFYIDFSIYEGNMEVFFKLLSNFFHNTWRLIPDKWMQSCLMAFKELLIDLNLKLSFKDRKYKFIFNNIIENRFKNVIDAMDIIIPDRISSGKFFEYNDDIVPEWDNEIPIIFSCDDKFVKYLCVTIQSILECSSDKNKYELIILYMGMNKFNQSTIKNIVRDYKNFKITFFWMGELVNKFNARSWKTQPQLGVSTYFRLFIPLIMKNFSKAIYLDCDTIVMHDVSEMYKVDLNNHYIGAVKDYGMSTIASKKDRDKNFFDFYNNFCGIYDFKSFFNAGILLLNIEKILRDNIFDQFLKTVEKLNQFKNYKFYADQEVLNTVFKDKVLLDESWNVQVNNANFLELLSIAPGIDKCNIIHYIGILKPWKSDCPNSCYKELWWKYARKTPCYEDLLYQYINNYNANLRSYIDLLSYKKLYIKYIKCKLLSHITVGKRRQHYINKKKILKERLRMAVKLKQFYKF